MRKTIFLLCLLTIIACKTKKIDTVKQKKVVLSEMNAEENSQEKKAYEIGKRVLNTCNTNEFIPFTESEATEKVRNNSKLEKLKKICFKFNKDYGSFKDLEFIEMIYRKKDSSNTYRFKAHYEKDSIIKEMRVKMNKKNKASAITTKDWKDIME